MLPPTAMISPRAPTSVPASRYRGPPELPDWTITPPVKAETFDRQYCASQIWAVFETSVWPQLVPELIALVQYPPEPTLGSLAPATGLWAVSLVYMFPE